MKIKLILNFTTKTLNSIIMNNFTINWYVNDTFKVGHVNEMILEFKSGAVMWWSGGDINGNHVFLSLFVHEDNRMTEASLFLL